MLTKGILEGSLPSYSNFYPRTYIAPRIESPPFVIDGNLSKPEWELAPWSELFDDIRGPKDVPSENDRPPASCSTRIKMMWDDHYLFIGALLHADADYPVRTSFRNRNDPIFQQDSDFEVFLDPTGTTHQYKEFEINAFNTVWNLLLDKPYLDGGQEHSGRVAKPGDDLYYDVYNQKTAVMLLEGNVNTPSITIWSIEIAMAFSDILATVPSTMNKDMIPGKLNYHTTSESPTHIIPNQRWRINFSRVERKGDINWTWQPQVEWNPQTKRYQGMVNMHLPNAWGYLVFGDSNTYVDQTNSKLSMSKDPTWPIRMAAMMIYAAQHAYRETQIVSVTSELIESEKDLQEKSSQSSPNFALHLEDLKEWLDEELLNDTVSHVQFQLPAARDTFHATLCSKDGLYVATIEQDRYLQVMDVSSCLEADKGDLGVASKK
jgi:hypothetical protein